MIRILNNKYTKLISRMLLIALMLLILIQTTYAASYTAGTATELIDAINTANGDGVADVITLTANITLDATSTAYAGDTRGFLHSTG
jgi:hypothetical protein